MKRIVTLIVAVVVALALANTAIADPVITNITGTVAGGVTITGTGFGTGPKWMYYSDFEKPADITARIDSTTASNYCPNFKFSVTTGDSSYAHYWFGKRMDVASIYPWHLTTDQAKGGLYSIGGDMTAGSRSGANGSDFNQNCWLSLGRAAGKLQGTGQGEVFVSGFFYNEMDTASINTETFRQRLITLVGASAAANVHIGAAISDSMTFRNLIDTTWRSWAGTTASPTGASYKRMELMANKWNQIEAWIKGESSASASDGKIVTYMNGAATDTARNINYGTSTTPWTNIRFVTQVAAADSFDTYEVYWDNIYVADGPERVVFGDKITYGLCTKRYIQPARAWSSTSITVEPTYGDLDPSGKIYVFVIGESNRGAGALCLATLTAQDSILVHVPVLTASVDSTTTTNTSYTFTFDNDADDDAGAYTNAGYNAVVGSYTINWGDGTNQTVTTSTSPTHTYINDGFYRVIVSAANAAGTGTGKMWLRVYDAAGSAGSFPNREMWLASAVQSGKKDAGYGANIFQFNAREYEMKVALYGYDSTAGRWYRVRPPVLVTGADSVLTVPRGVPLTVDLGSETARAFTYWSPDSTPSSLWASWK